MSGCKIVDLAERRALVEFHKLINKPADPEVILKHTCGNHVFFISDAGIVCEGCKEIISLWDIADWIDEQNK